MSFYYARDTLNKVIHKRILALTPESAHVKVAFAASTKSTTDWRKALNQIQLSNTEDDLQTAITTIPPTLRDELLTHEHDNLHQNRTLRFFPMGYLLDRSIRLLFSERGKHSQEFKHILGALNPAHADSAAAYCRTQTYRTQELPIKPGEPRPEELLDHAESTLGDQYPGAFCMLNKAFSLNSSLPAPLPPKGRTKQALTAPKPGPTPTGM